MESAITRLQDFINEYVAYHLRQAIDLFALKSEYWERETLQTHINDEIHNSSCELIALHEKHPILHAITDFEDYKNVLWESTFIESLSLEERKKYRNAENLRLRFNDLKLDATIYDKQIPYFSALLSVIYLTEYIAYLQSRKPKNNTETFKTPQPEEKITFESKLTPTQIDLLTTCINEVRLFSENITSQQLTDIFCCELAQPLKSRNNRLLVYFFSALDDRSLITRNWQSVIDKNRLLLSSGKNNPLTQTDLSSAKTELKDASPKGSETIDNYLKQLKKH